MSASAGTPPVHGRWWEEVHGDPCRECGTSWVVPPYRAVADVEAVPTRHLRDPKMPEWGRPVMIDLPAGVGGSFTPGEQVDVKFIPSSVVSSAVGG